jgi:hypothetical protein
MKRTLLLALLALALFNAPVSSFAQGFPGGGGGGGGHGHGGFGGNRPPGNAGQNATAPQKAPDPLIVFLGNVRALRMTVLIGTNQVDAWNAMQDALVAYAEAARDAAEPPNATITDAAVQLGAFADKLAKRSDAAKAVDARIGALLAVLDAHQKEVFLAKLGEAFGAAPG